MPEEELPREACERATNETDTSSERSSNHITQISRDYWMSFFLYFIKLSETFLPEKKELHQNNSYRLMVTIAYPAKLMKLKKKRKKKKLPFSYVDVLCMTTDLVKLSFNGENTTSNAHAHNG